MLTRNCPALRISLLVVASLYPVSWILARGMGLGCPYPSLTRIMISSALLSYLASLHDAAKPPREARGLWIRIASLLLSALAIALYERELAQPASSNLGVSLTVFIGICGFVTATLAVRHVKAADTQEAEASGSDAILAKGSFSERERQVLRLFSEGRTQREIGESLGIGCSTVGTYCARIYEKAGVANGSELRRLLLPPKTEPSSCGDTQSEAHGLQRRFRNNNVIANVPYIGLLSATILLAQLLGAACYPNASKANVTSLSLSIFLLGAQVRTLRHHGRPGEGAYPSQRLAVALALLLASLGLRYIAAGRLIGLALAALIFVIVITRAHTHGATPHGTRRSIGYISQFAMLGLLCLGPKYPIAGALFPLVHLDTTCIGALSIIGSALLGAYALLAQDDTSPYEQDLSYAGAHDERAIFYLRGRGLSELQSRVLLLTAKGASATAIATTLTISKGTVSSYRQRAYSRLGIHTRQELREILGRDTGIAL